MQIDDILECVLEEMSGQIAKKHTRRIAQFHRIQGSPGFLEAAKYVRAQLKKIGLPKTKIWSFPADGKTMSWTWEAPISWKIEDARLTLIKPKKQTLIEFKAIPHGIVTHSQKADMTAEVIDVGEGLKDSDYANKNVTNKIVLTTGRASEVHRIAIKHGALGLIVYPPIEKASVSADLILYSSLWPTGQERQTTTFGFSISHQQAHLLKSYLVQGKKVKVHAKINAELYDGWLNVLSAEIPGRNRSGKEVTLIAHLCHPKPSANDNASGSGLLIEIARTIKKLIAQRKLPQPKHTLRFLWVPEFHGTVAWLRANQTKAKRTLGLLNLDMVGESPREISSPLYLIQSPHSVASHLNDLIAYLLKKIADDPKTLVADGYQGSFNYRLRPFMGASDHALYTDACFGVPSVMFYHPDKFHHSHLDTIDMVDPTELKRIGVVASAAVLSLAHPSDEIVTHLALLTKSGVFARLNDHLAKASKTLLGFEGKKKRETSTVLLEALTTERDKLRFLVKHAVKSLESIKVLSARKLSKDFIHSLVGQIEKFGQSEEDHLRQLYKSVCRKLKLKTGPKSYLSADAKRARQIIPQRNYPGPLSRRVLDEQDEEIKEHLKNSSFKINTTPFLEALNFTNEHNSVYDIYIALATEFNNINLSDVIEFFETAQKASIIKT